MATRDGFEDGDVSDWDKQSFDPPEIYDNFNATTETAREGSYSAKIVQSTNQDYEFFKTPSGGKATPNKIEGSIRYSSTANVYDQFVQIAWRDGIDFAMYIFIDTQADELVITGNSRPASQNTWYHVEFEQIDWQNHTIGEIYLNGSLEYTNVPFPDDLNAYTSVELFSNISMLSGDDPSTTEVWFDQVTIGDIYADESISASESYDRRLQAERSYQEQVNLSANVSFNKATVSGRVELPKGVGVQGAEVYAYNKSRGEFLGYDVSDSNGDYSISVPANPTGDEILVAADYIGPERDSIYTQTTSASATVGSIETNIFAKEPLYIDEAWVHSVGAEVTVEIENSSGTVVASKTYTAPSGTSSITFSKSDYSELVEGDFILRISSNDTFGESSQKSFEGDLFSINNETHAGFPESGENQIFSVSAESKVYGEEKSIKYEKTS